jgi:hypothetical protein
MNPLEHLHNTQRQAQAQYHEGMQTQQKQQHERHQQEVAHLHKQHQQELKQMHQRHAAHHEQITGAYETMPPDHVKKLSEHVGQQQQKEIAGLAAQHQAQEQSLHAAHFRDHHQNLMKGVLGVNKG